MGAGETAFGERGGMENPQNPGLAREGERSFFAFDTYNIIHVNAPADVVEECVALCLRYNGQLSRFIADSEVGRLNASAGSPFRCSGDMMRMLRLAQALYEETHGAYNIAVGPVMDLWNFGTEPLQLPQPEALHAALAACDFSAVVFDGDTVTLPAGMRIDLGSIAKGYIIDRAAEFLVENGVTSGFLNFGGNTLAIGPKEGGAPWRFGLQEPYAAFGKKFWAVLESDVGAFSTSGGYERGATLDGVRYHHLIDSRTGYPVRNNLLTATVYAGNATMADTLSTCLFVLGPEAGMQLAADLGVGALMRTENGSVHATPGFPFRLFASGQQQF